MDRVLSMNLITMSFDDSEFLYAGPSEQMTEQGVDARLDIYSGTGIGEMVFCVAGRRSNVKFDAEGWEPRWETDGELSEAVNNARLLHERSIDPYQRWLKRSRELGMKAWLGIRANDVHHTPVFDHPYHPEYWRNHPELWRRPYRLERDIDRGFDYGQAPVCDRLLALVHELTERYDMDGLEIDWMRKPWSFAPGHEQAGSIVVTQMMRSMREILNRYADHAGHRVELCVRVPQTPEDCRGFGFDVVAWARQGLVDRVAPCPDMVNNNDIPVDLWKDLLHGTNVLVCPGVNIRLMPHPMVSHHKFDGRPWHVEPDVIRGTAAALLHRGGDRIHFFNMYSPKAWGVERYRQMLIDCANLDSLAPVSRRHVLTFNDTPCPGTRAIAQLPAPVGPSGNLDLRSSAIPDTRDLRIYTGPVPANQQVQVRLAFAGATPQWGDRGYIPDGAEVRLNGIVCEHAGVIDLPEATPNEALWGFNVPADTLHDGYNLMEVFTTRATTIEWAEIAVLTRD